MNALVWSLRFLGQRRISDCVLDHRITSSPLTSNNPTPQQVRLRYHSTHCVSTQRQVQCSCGYNGLQNIAMK